MKKSFTTFAVLSLALTAVIFAAGCAVEASKATQSEKQSELNSAPTSETAKSGNGPTIEIKPESPADTVRTFYKLLHDKKFRDAIFLTNLRPAIEGLTDSELKEFRVDFEGIADMVPPVIQIDGEIISGNNATVTAKLPAPDKDKAEIQEIRLRNENGVWVILSADDDAEKKIKAEGKNYFYSLRIATHEEEARKMLDRISKAQMVYSLQNGGGYGDLAQLVAAGLLPEDAQNTESTGYKYIVTLLNGKGSWSAKAVPAAYGKTGKLTFSVDLNEKGQPHLTSKDYGK